MDKKIFLKILKYVEVEQWITYLCIIIQNVYCIAHNFLVTRLSCVKPRVSEFHLIFVS